MSLDTKYRPHQFEDVLGQEGAVTVLRRFVETGTGFQQSYLFCGQHGSGKTTLGRILARALLCDNPTGGNPCDQCQSCLAILEHGASECFIECDAATNSGKDDIRKIVEGLQYDTFSGKRRIYLFDESHQLSRQALDALLKPMEENAPGSEDKLLVCIFCTTEPDKMRATVFSRCAPAFVIRPVSPEGIAARLAQICEAEGVGYEMDALVAVAEATECHIRDALKAIEGVALLGDITQERVRKYLRLEANALYLKIIAGIGTNLPAALKAAGDLVALVSPATAYTRLAEVTMMMYRVNKKAGRAPSFWRADHIERVGDHHKEFLVVMAEMFASRPGRPNLATLTCDISKLHHQRRGSWGQVVPTPVTMAPPVPTAGTPPVQADRSTSAENSSTTADSPEAPGRVMHPTPPAPAEPRVTSGGVYVDERAVRKVQSSEPTASGPIPMDARLFQQVLEHRVHELERGGRRGGPARWSDLGDPGAVPSG